MNRTAQPVYITYMAVLGLVLLGSCSSPAATPTPMVISPTLTTTTTPIPNTAAVTDASFPATLNINMTQNAVDLATSTAKITATGEARLPTSTPTRPPTTIPTDEGMGVVVHGVLVHYADTRTGLDDVDPIIETVLAGDMNALRQRIKYTTLGCTQEMALGGPPNCREGEPEGTLVDVLPFLGPEGHFLRRDEIYKWRGIDVAGLYAVYRVSDEAYSPKEYPAGEYGIVFRTKSPQDIVTLRVENGRILRVDSLFGTPPEVDFERDAQEIILPPPDIDSGCPGAPPQRVAIGMQAAVCTISDDLIVRQGPGLASQQLTGIESGTNFMIIDGPACANNWFWWKADLDSGLAGWVAEGGDNIDPYFICPVN
ncbi:MAG: SH3 domain-containing protein [Anaerolineales bacterium]|nr:MAG: SH3 domain-containing protein [Anaerolineales bacterium]